MCARTPPVILALALVATAAQAQTRAAVGDDVSVVFYPVEAADRDAFESFVEDVFWPAADLLTGADAQVFRQTRVLYPEGPSEDGTYAYAYLMDPLLEGGDYGIESLLKKAYGDERGAEHFRTYASLVGDYWYYETTQSPTGAGDPNGRAGAGEDVLVVVTPVGADQREAYEAFVEDVFWPAADAVAGTGLEALVRGTRVLYPKAPQPDGSYAYLFVMDPAVEGGDYGLENLLRAAYGDELGRRHYRTFAASLAGDQTPFWMTQSPN